MQWEERRDQGAPVAAEELCRDDPELLPEVKRRIADLEMIKTLVPANPAKASESSPAREKTPERLGRFEIKEQLGGGGFGSVYRAYDPQLGRDVALKIPHQHLMTGERRERFLREARAAAQLRHANLVAVHDCGVGKDDSYIAYGLVAGRTLAQVLKGQSFTPVEAAELIRKLAQAVHYAHSKGVIHRDIKSANVLIDEQGEPYITDFGLVRLEGDSTLTADAVVLGTPAYMSPEQAGGASHQADARSDVYSLSVVLYELLAGRLPFVGSTHSVLRQLIEKEPPALRSVNRRIPRDLETICLKAMAKSPQDRYASAQHFADDLQRWLNHESILARPATTPERFWRWCRRNPVVAGLLGGLLVAIITGAAVSAYYWGQAVEQGQRVRRQLYVSRMKETHAAWENSEIKRMLDLLEMERPMAGEDDLRSFEWFYLWRLCHSEQRTIPSKDMIGRITIHPSEKYLAVTYFRSGDLDVLDIHTGEPVHSFNGNGEKYIDVDFSPDGRWLAAGGHNQEVNIWQFETGELVRTLRGHTGTIQSVEFSPDGRRLAAASYDEINDPPQFWGEVITWDVATGRNERTLKAREEPWGDGIPRRAAWHPDGKHVAVAGVLVDVKKLERAGGKVLVWNTEDNRIVSTLPGLPDSVGQVAFSPDGQRLLSAGVDRVARIWDWRQERVIHRLPDRTYDFLHAGFSPDGKSAATVGGDRGVIRLWDAETGALTRQFKGHASETTFAFSPDGQRLYSACTNEEGIKVWHVNAEQDCRTLKGFAGGAAGVAVSPDSRCLAIGAGDGTIRIWDLIAECDVLSWKAHNEAVWGLAFHPDGNQLASGSRDGHLRIWDIGREGEAPAEPTNAQKARQEPRPPAQLTAFGVPDAGRYVFSVDWSPDGERLAAGLGSKKGHDQAGLVVVWDATPLPLLRKGGGWGGG